MSVSLRIHSLIAQLPVVLVLLSGAYNSNAYAQEDGETGWAASVGAGVLTSTSAWVGINSQVAVVPYFDIRKGHWQFNASNLVGYQLALDKSFDLTVGLGIRNDGYDSYGLTLNDLSKDPLFAGYSKPDTEAVLNVGMSYGRLSLNATRDISNNSKSNSLNLSADLPVYEGDNGLSVRATASAIWNDSNYVNYYYGVADGQIDNSVGRVAYQAGDAINYELGINALYPIGERWGMLGSIGRTKLGSSIVNSPLTDSDYTDTAVLMLIYQF